jgi:SpoVK/Ycf46/Vps4 family AAA+-type ATPase
MASACVSVLFEYIYHQSNDLHIPQVVNALLTQLDKLKHRKNVLVMATSNLVKAIGEILFHSSLVFTISRSQCQYFRLLGLS